MFALSWLGICINAILLIAPEKEVWWCQSPVNKEAIQHFHAGRSDAQGTVFIGILLWLLAYVVELHLAESTVFSFGSHCPVFELADVTLEVKTPEACDDNCPGLQQLSCRHHSKKKLGPIDTIPVNCHPHCHLELRSWPLIYYFIARILSPPVSEVLFVQFTRKVSMIFICHVKFPKKRIIRLQSS